MLYQQMWEAWAEAEGYEIEYGEDGMPTEPGVRLMSYTYANEHAAHPPLNHAQVYNRLAKFEREGLVNRLVLPHHSRSILWFRPLSTTADGLP